MFTGSGFPSGPLQGFSIVAVPFFALVVYLAYMRWGRRRDRAPRATYLFTVMFIALLAGLQGIIGLATSVSQAIADPPGGVDCSFQPFDTGSDDASTDASGLSAGTYAQAPTFPPIPTIDPELFEFDVPEIQQVPPPIEVPDGLQDPQEFFEEFEDFPTPGDCRPVGARSLSPVTAARGGILGLVAGAIWWFHGQAAMRLLKEEENDG